MRSSVAKRPRARATSPRERFARSRPVVPAMSGTMVAMWLTWSFTIARRRRPRSGSRKYIRAAPIATPPAIAIRSAALPPCLVAGSPATMPPLWLGSHSLPFDARSLAAKPGGVAPSSRDAYSALPRSVLTGWLPCSTASARAFGTRGGTTVAPSSSAPVTVAS